MLVEAAIAVGFYALGVPFGYLSRRVKRSQMDGLLKWPLFLGVVHAPVLPLIAYVKLTEVEVNFEILLVAVLLSGHATGLLVHRMRHKSAPAPAPAAN